MPRSPLLALAFAFRLTLPFLIGSAPPAASAQQDGGAPLQAPFDAGFQPVSPRDSSAYAHVDWLHIPPQKYESSTTHYVSHVKPGNQVALNQVAVPFAAFLVAIHKQIHPAFADAFLGMLDERPASDPLNNPRLFTSLEIGIDACGHVGALGVVHPSGEPAFDLAVVEAVTRAGPYPVPPHGILSPDGNVWFHWEFHRNEVFACSTMNARPFILTTPPADAGSRDGAPSHL